MCILENRQTLLTFDVAINKRVGAIHGRWMYRKPIKESQRPISGENIDLREIFVRISVFWISFEEFWLIFLIAGRGPINVGIQKSTDGYFLSELIL